MQKLNYENNYLTPTTHLERQKVNKIDPLLTKKEGCNSTLPIISYQSDRMGIQTLI
jgi:hypothetical protein